MQHGALSPQGGLVGEDEATHVPLLSSVDVMQLAALAAAASSAASSTAFAVDAVVTEAILFFATMPPLQGRRLTTMGSDGSTDTSEEVFKVFGKRAHADACVAAEACAQAHQLVTRDTSRNGGGKGGNNASGNTGSLNSAMAAALAAGRVGTHAERTAATAREAAQLCMGILEEAVQASASPFARETAKRCAEQALHSIEAATVAEQHSRSLRELFTRVMLNSEYQTRTSLSTPSMVSVTGGLGGMPHLGQGTAPTAGSAQLPTVQRSVATSPNSRRWWDQEPEMIPLFRAEAPSSIAAVASGSRASPQPPTPPVAATNLKDASASSDELDTYLNTRIRLCAEAANRAVGGRKCDDGGDTTCQGQAPNCRTEDELALQAIIEWRYGQALALGCKEEELLSDLSAVRLAYWKCPPDEQVPIDMIETVQQKGADHFAGLVMALRSSTREARKEQLPRSNDETQSPFLGAFHPLNDKVDSKGEQSDWDEVFDRLGWTPSTCSAQPNTNRKPKTSQGAAPEIPEQIGMWALDKLAGAAPASHGREIDGCIDTQEDDWSVDAMTSNHLHLMSMQSRSKQRRGGVVKHKASVDDVATSVQPGAITTGGSAVVPALAPVVGDDSELRQWLQEVYSEMELPLEDEQAQTQAPSGTSYGDMATSAASGSREAPKRSNKKKKPFVASVSRAGAGEGHSLSLLNDVTSSVAATPSVTASPVYRLIEPPQLLDAAMNRSCSDRRLPDDDDLDDNELEVIRDELSDQPHDIFMQSRPAWGPDEQSLGLISRWEEYLPGQLLQRLPRTFNENMEHIAVKRREAYGVPAGLGRSMWSSHLAAPLGPETRARTFNEGVRLDHPSPILTPAGPFIRTPTWTSADSGEFASMVKEDPSSPLYVQASPRRWASEHCDEVSMAPNITSSGSEKERAGNVAGSGGAINTVRRALDPRLPWS